MSEDTVSVNKKELQNNYLWLNDNIIYKFLTRVSKKQCKKYLNETVDWFIYLWFNKSLKIFEWSIVIYISSTIFKL